MNILRFSNYARISLWTMAGLFTGTVAGAILTQDMQGVANLGFAGGCAGVTIGLVACMPWTWFLQAVTAGVLSGVVVGLLNVFLLETDQSTLEIFVGPVVGFPIGFIIYRFNGRHKKSFYFRSHK